MRGKARSKRRASTECPDLVPEERIFANPSALSPHLLCPICQEVFTHPQRAPCGHSFCKRCIELWIENASICPIDRKPITSGSMHHDFILENIIGDYMVACPFRALGCGFIGRLCLLPSHKKSCSLNPNEMPPVLRNHAISSLKEGNSNLQNPELLYKRRVADRTYSSMARTETDTETSSEIAGSSSQEIGIQEEDASRRLNEENGEQTPGHTDDNEVELPATPIPSLIYRMYMKGDEKRRELLCKFLESRNTSPCTRSTTKKNHRRTREPDVTLQAFHQ